MAELSTLARPYAKAIFELAYDEGKLIEWSTMLSGLAKAVADPRVAAAIGHPAVGRGQLAEILIQAMGAASPQAKNVLRLLAEYNRLRLVPSIAAQYERLRADAEARIDVEIVSATPVDAAQQQALAGAIKKRLKREVNIEWQTDESLVAGARVRAGDLIIDGSVAGELEQLRHALTT
jgi:F-type H+-transporting ATPase subunit delta